jgi:hypothetical protein
MLSEAQKAQLGRLATTHYHDGMNMGGSIYKAVEERDGSEKAEEALSYYVNRQKLLLEMDNIEAAANSYQQSVEM